MGRQISRGYVDTHVGQLHYREAGSGEPLVLLHKSPSSSAFFERAIPHLAEHYRVIAIDTPGYGMSDPFPEKPPGLAPHAAAVAEALRALDATPAVVVGQHTGGSIGTEMLASQPESLRALVVCGILACATQEERDAYLAAAKAKAPAYMFGFQLDARGDFLEEYRLAGLRATVDPDDGEQFLVELIDALQPIHHTHWTAQLVVEHDVYRCLDAASCPIAFLNLLGDYPAVFETTKLAHEYAEGSLYRELEGKPSVVMDDPARWAGAVLELCTATTATRT
jgi:pimeloyl-ACP methyl ester carboxylesterase